MSRITRDELMAALEECISSAPLLERKSLARALEGYASRYRVNYKNLCNGDSLIAAILDTLESATEASIERDSNGVPL